MSTRPTSTTHRHSATPTAEMRVRLDVLAVGVGVAYVLGVVVAMGRVSYDVWGAFVLAPVLLAPQRERPQWLDTSHPHVKAALLRGSRGALLLPIWLGPGTQYV